MILGALSGIQNYLFNVRESGGKQAATLRFRSLRVQLIAECIARRVLWALDLPEQQRLLYCAAGKFAIDATGAASVDSRLDPIRADIDKWLLEQTHGRLRCAIVADESQGTAAQRNDAAHDALQRRKCLAKSTVFCHCAAG
jgi:CRISPR/Cas system-associated protein Cas10 (large subunit of type III CRISPR-Cas system)